MIRLVIGGIGALMARDVTNTRPIGLGEPVSTLSPMPWATAHGDLHFANLCAPNLHLLDWEGWGLAPAGYNAATLHSHSLHALDRRSSTHRVRRYPQHSSRPVRGSTRPTRPTPRSERAVSSVIRLAEEERGAVAAENHREELVPEPHEDLERVAARIAPVDHW